MEDYEFRWRAPTPSRSTRATSAVPASLKHYEDLNAESSYNLNSSSSYLKQSSSSYSSSRRAISEARDLVRESSVPPRSFYGAADSARKSRLEDIKEYTKDILNSDDANLFSVGNYKITITPTAESWTRPSRFWYSPYSATTAALLDAYSPRRFPDFVFGKIGWTPGQGIRAGRAVSVTPSSYFSRPSSYWVRRPSSVAPGPAFDEESFYKRPPSVYNPPPRTTEPSYYSNPAPRSDFYRPIYESKPLNVDRTSKFYHYYIPRHYPGTPMLGGYLMPTGGTYKWKY